MYAAYAQYRLSETQTTTHAHNKVQIPAALAVLSVIAGVGVVVIQFTKPMYANYLVRQAQFSDNSVERMRLYTEAWDISRVAQRTIANDSEQYFVTHMSTDATMPLAFDMYAKTTSLIRSYPFTVSLWVLRSDAARILSAADPSYLYEAYRAADAAVVLGPTNPGLYRLRSVAGAEIADISGQDSIQYRKRALADAHEALTLNPRVEDSQVLWYTLNLRYHELSMDTFLNFVQSQADQFKIRDWHMALDELIRSNDQKALARVYGYLRSQHSGDAEYSDFINNIQQFLSS